MQDPEILERYFVDLAASFVRGKLSTLPAFHTEELFESGFESLSVQQQCELFRIGLENELRLHKFKRTMGLPRVKKVIGKLHGIVPQRLLDIGTGRGVFLWALLDSIALLEVHCVDVRQDRVADLNAVAAGGVERLRAIKGDVHHLPFDENQFDVVTALEVIEHVNDPAVALAELCRVSKRFLIMSVPSKADDNPEHIHLFNESRLRNIFSELGYEKMSFDYVPGHIILTVNLN